MSSNFIIESEPYHTSLSIIQNFLQQRFKQATAPILRRVKELCALLATGTEMKSAVNSEAYGSRRDCEFSSSSGSRYDTVTGVQRNSHRRTRLQWAASMDNLTNHDQEQSEDDNNEPHMTQLMNAITNVLRWTISTPKGTNCSILKCPPSENRRSYNEFEHLFLNHMRPVQNKITEEEKLQFSQAKTPLNSGRPSEWSQTPHSESSSRCSVKKTQDDFKEVPRYWRDQLKKDPQHESFSDFFKHPKKKAKQAFNSKASEYVTEILFGKLPIAIQNDLSVAGKKETTVDEIKDFFSDGINTNSSWGHNSLRLSMKPIQAPTNAKMNASPEKTPSNGESSAAYASTATRKSTKLSIAGQENGNSLSMIYHTWCPVNNSHNEYKTNGLKRGRIVVINSFVMFVDIRVTQHSHADKEAPTPTPVEVSRTNARTQMRIEAFGKTSNRGTNDSSPSAKWKKPAATPPTPEMKPTNPIL